LSTSTLKLVGIAVVMVMAISILQKFYKFRVPGGSETV